VRAIDRDAALAPVVEVFLGYLLVFVCVVGAAEEGCELAEGFDADDTFEGEVGLERQPTGEVVGANW
jgi:hypothetical protein